MDQTQQKTARRDAVYTVATAHLDTVWDWTFETTVKEYLHRTLADNFALFKQYPDYRFSFEGAYRYELMEEYEPALFAQLKEYVAQGRWNVAGSAYENGDVNVPSPEALFRNFLYGNGYFDKTFGKRSKDVYLPDCFGFGWALPSIAAHANLLGFTTQKLSWGSAYGCPFDLGVWQGVDGHSIYASLMGGSYTKQVDGVRARKDVRKKLQENKAKYGLNKTFLLYGAFDDRGGAPEPRSVKAVCAEAAQNGKAPVDVLPAASDQVFRDLDAELTQEEKARLPRWNNELVMSAHGAGGYTSRAVGKRWNRKNELLADETERCAVTADWLGALPYPREKLETAWKRVIAHQFHDDIPGTSLYPVYQRSWNDYMLSLNQFAEEYRAAAAGVSKAMDTMAQGIPLLVHNPVEAARCDAVAATVYMDTPCRAVRVFDAEGNEVPSQVNSGCGRRFDITFLAQMESLGYAVFDVRPSETPCAMPSKLSIERGRLENERYTVQIDENGDIASIVDRSCGGKELLRAPIRLGLYAYNGSTIWPAWELNYKELCKAPREYAGDQSYVKPYRVHTEIVENGPARVALKITRKGDYPCVAPRSTFTQILSLSAQGDALEVYHEIDWQSERTLLKVEFPLTASNPKATYDLGLGVIERGNNTKQLNEVPAQLWADLTASDGSYGVSILSDCKSGWDKPDDHTLRLTAIHTPKQPFYPDGKEHRYSEQSLLDLGLNRFSFAIFGHAQDWRGGTQLAAKRFTQPLTAFQIASHPGDFGKRFSFGSISNGDVLIRAVKKAEDSDEVIVRVNEAAGRAQQAVRLTLGAGIVSAREVYASEEPLGDAKVENGSLLFDIGAFEPKTFALTLAAAPVQVQPDQSVPLALLFNLDAVSSNGDRTDGAINPQGETIPAELFPRQIVCGPCTFETGSALPGEKNAVAANGQVLQIPEGCRAVALLACSTNGDKRTVFQAGGEEIVVNIQDYKERIGVWDLYAAEETGRIKKDVLAWNATHTHLPSGDTPAVQLYLFRYLLPIPADARTLTLPADADILLFAASAVDATDCRTAVELVDSLDPRPFFYSRSDFKKTPTQWRRH